MDGAFQTLALTVLAEGYFLTLSGSLRQNQLKGSTEIPVFLVYAFALLGFLRDCCPTREAEKGPMVSPESIGKTFKP